MPGFFLVFLTDMRSTLNPCFTSKKLRQMFNLVNNVASKVPSLLGDDIAAGCSKEIDFKNLSTKCAVDIIATCAYGIEVNSLKGPANIFSKLTQTFDHIVTPFNILKFTGILLVPKITNFFKIRFLGKEFTELFSDGIFEMINLRKKEKIFRPDLVNLLMEIKQTQEARTNEEKTRNWSDEHLSAQCLAFFIGGYATIATSMGFTAYEIACNSDVQQKLYQEILDTNENLDGRDLDYNVINEMKYMNQVISESLRKWPSSPLTGRACREPYNLKFDDKEFYFDSNIDFLVPIICFHRDPKYFPNPEIFDPERFNEENRKTIDPDTFIPFGAGPRHCIGTRFALMELKTVFYHLLLKFKFELSPKTDFPIQLDKSPFEMKPKNGIWIKLVNRLN